MSYMYNMIIRKEYLNQYTLMTNKGVVFCSFRATSDGDAMNIAKIWMSTWGSVNISMEESKDEPKKGN
jgi:hypothetical protein